MRSIDERQKNIDTTERVRHFLARAYTRSMLPYLAIGLLLIEVYFGYAGRYAARLAGSDVHTTHLHDLVIFGGLVVCVVVMVLVSRMARKTLTRAVAETETDNAQSEYDSHTA